MNRITYPNVDLNCIFQQVEKIGESQCLKGLISRQGDGAFRFEETIHKGRPPRNPKLFDGDHISMVRMQNGKYQFHMKTLPDGFNREKLPFAVYNEIMAALEIIG